MSREKLIIFFATIFTSTHLFIPFFDPDLYPFSAFPMFSDGRKECINDIIVNDRNGRRLNGVKLGLFTYDVLINPRPKFGCGLGKPLLSDKDLNISDDDQQAISKKLCELDYPEVIVSRYRYCKGEEITIEKSILEVAPEC